MILPVLLEEYTLRFHYSTIPGDDQPAQIKAPGYLHISHMAELRINHMPITVDGSREKAACSFDLDRGFIHIPGSPSLPISPGSSSLGDEWSKALFPLSNGFMRQDNAALQTHLSQLAQTHRRAQPPQDNQ